MKLLITGCGRSGTMWMATALRTAGLDCGHERAFTVAGTEREIQQWSRRDQAVESSGYAAPFTPLPDTYTVHLVRHPLSVIASVLHRGGPLRRSDYVARWFPEIADIPNRLERSAHYWVLWNGIIEADELLRLEDVTTGDVRRLVALTGANTAKRLLLPGPQNASPQRPRPVRWSQVRNVPGLMAAAERYGYEP